MKKIFSMALVCLTCLGADVAWAQITAKTEAAGVAETGQWGPMESVVCAVDSDYCIVRDDQTRRNTFTVRHRLTHELAFDVKFEKYLDTFTIDGRPMVAIAAWNPGFGYLWSAWLRDGEGWRQLLLQMYTDVRLVVEEGQPSRLECDCFNGKHVAYTLKDLFADE